MAEYYGQRASDGGLIIAEATVVERTAQGYLGAPGIFSEEQVTGWRKVTDAIHRKGGKVFLQLWHVGRVSHKDLNGGAVPVGPSEIPFDGVAFTEKGMVPVTPNRALRSDEVPAVIEAFRSGAVRAQDAGYDGVEIHAANGYLFDQFLQDGINKRTDSYGGSVANRARLLLETVPSVVKVWGRDRVGVRLSPAGKFNGMSDSNPPAIFGYVAEKLGDLGIAYLHVVEPRVVGSQEVAFGIPPVAAAQLKARFKGTIIAAGGYNPADAEVVVRNGEADLVAFGRHFIANPDLPERIRSNLSLHPYDRSTFYGGDRRGYTDYPAAALNSPHAVK